jgi:hypothetical protein
VRTDIREVIPGAYQPGTGPAPSPAVPQPEQPHYDAPQSQPPQSSYLSETQPYEPEPTTSPAIAPEEKIVGPDVKETGEETYTRSELVSLRKDDLVKIARDKGMKTSGTKRDLIDRILGEGD